MTPMQNFAKAHELKHDLAQAYAQSRALIEESRLLCLSHPGPCEVWCLPTPDATPKAQTNYLAEVIMAEVLARYNWDPLPRQRSHRKTPAGP